MQRTAPSLRRRISRRALLEVDLIRLASVVPFSLALRIATATSNGPGATKAASFDLVAHALVHFAAPHAGLEPDFGDNAERGRISKAPAGLPSPPELYPRHQLAL